MNEIVKNVEKYFSGEKTITRSVFSKYKKWIQNNRMVKVCDQEKEIDILNLIPDADFRINAMENKMS